MKQQILFISGGNTFGSKKDYLSWLKNLKMNIEKTKAKLSWRDTLHKKLGNKFEVYKPKMPNSINASYTEWSILFNKIIKLLNDNLILIGHSLGGIFLAKYLAENDINKKIKATILISAPFGGAGGESLGSFVLPKSLKKLEQQAGKIYLIQSKDDKVVPLNQVKKYKKELPRAILKIFKDREHFSQESFPEIVELIKGIK